MKLNTKITLALLISFLIISLILLITYMVNLKKNQIDNIDSFRNEFVEVSLELLESNSDLFFQHLEMAGVDNNVSSEQFIDGIEKLASNYEGVVLYDIRTNEFVQPYGDQKFADLIDKEKIESLLRRQLLDKKSIFSIDNYDIFLRGNKTLVPTKIYFRIYEKYGLLVGYGKSFNSGKIRIEFIEGQNKDYYKKSLIVSIITLVIVMFLIPTISLMLIKKWIISPVFKLGNMSKNIANGNFNYKSNIDSDDEMGELSESFNSMAKMLQKSKKKLENYNSELERDIKKRTIELKIKNDELEHFNNLVIDRELRMIELKKEISELKRRRGANEKI